MAILNLIKRQLRSAIEWQNQKTGCPVSAMSGGNKKNACAHWRDGTGLYFCQYRQQQIIIQEEC